MLRLIIIWLVTLTSSFVYGTAHEFEFVSNKMNGSLSKEFISKIIHTFHPDIFFETGTYDGCTTLNAAKFFGIVITVEVYAPLFEQVQSKFLRAPNVQSYLGNSSEIIANIGSQLKGTILFWLDAHYSGEGTGMTNSANSGSPEAITAIREELQAIHDAGIENCVILIDDIRGFGTQVHDHIFLGCWAYPTVQEVKAALLKINPQFEIALLGDMLLAYDASKYHPDFSPLVQALTKTRLYNGYNLNKKELNELGKKIKNCSYSEFVFIEQLYNMMSIYKDPMFWHDVWYGLVQMGKRNDRKAELLFQDAFTRIRSVTSEADAQKVFQSISKVWQRPPE